jgi:hypothetical protein
MQKFEISINMSFESFINQKNQGFMRCQLGANENMTWEYQQLGGTLNNKKRKVKFLDTDLSGV